VDDSKRLLGYCAGMKKQTPFGPSYHEIISTLEEAALAAGNHIQDAKKRKECLSVQVKSDKSLVLNLDVECQELILAMLASHSEIPIVAEETPSSHSLVDSAESYFLVDPLDGTTSCKRFLYEEGGQVGFGPLIGYVHGGVLSAAVFYSVPHRTLFSAVRSEGAFKSVYDSTGECLEAHTALRVSSERSLKEAGMLFFVSPYGESRIVEHFKNNHVVENIYRFGSFANDSARLAQGFEQVQFQLNAKPWDFSGVLLASEAGCEVYCDPLSRRIPLADWRIESVNPVVILQRGMRDEFFTVCDSIQ